MLKLVLGGSGSGKTTLLYSRIRARAEAGRYSILLVPEQFTSSTEGRIYRELGDALSGMVESFSFTSLAERILSAEGGAAVQTLSDAGRAVLVRRALEELQENVHYYYRNRRSAAFCQMAAETIDDLTELSVVHIYTAAQDYALCIYTEGISLLDMIVQKGCKKVICRGNRMKISCKMKVQILHRNYLRIAASGCSSFYSKAGAQGRLPQGNDRFFGKSAEGLSKPYRCGSLSFSGRCWIDRRNQDQFSIGIFGNLL